MKGRGGLAGLLLCGGLLTGCGFSTPTPPATGDLLSAPTVLTLNGQAVTAHAAPTLSGPRFSVRVQVRAARALPGLRVTGVYVVTNSGVWKSGVGTDGRQVCPLKAAASCALASGSASGFQAGQTVQVVTRLQDSAGHSLLLRDEEARITLPTTP